MFSTSKKWLFIATALLACIVIAGASYFNKPPVAVTKATIKSGQTIELISAERMADRSVEIKLKVSGVSKLPPETSLSWGDDIRLRKIGGLPFLKHPTCLEILRDSKQISDSEVWTMKLKVSPYIHRIGLRIQTATNRPNKPLHVDFHNISPTNVPVRKTVSGYEITLDRIYMDAPLIGGQWQSRPSNGAKCNDVYIPGKGGPDAMGIELTSNCPPEWLTVPLEPKLIADYASGQVITSGSGRIVRSPGNPRSNQYRYMMLFDRESVQLILRDTPESISFVIEHEPSPSNFKDLDWVIFDNIPIQ